MVQPTDFQITEEGDSFLLTLGDSEVILTREHNPYNMYEVWYVKRPDMQPKQFRGKRYLSLRAFLDEYEGELRKEEFLESKKFKYKYDPKKVKNGGNRKKSS